MMTLEEKLAASVRKYFLEPNPLEDGNRVKAVVADALDMCARELGYSSMDAARKALLPQSTMSFVQKHNLGRREIDREDAQRGGL